MSTSVILSIKPVFAQLIFSGQKRYEFRKVLFRNRDIRTVFVYSSAPISKVIGEFSIDTILRLEPEDLWFRTSKHAGISKAYFDSYFSGRDVGYAIKIGNTRVYDKPLELKDHFNLKQAPQSFAYVTSSVIS